MAVTYSIPRGTYDILPDKSFIWQYVQGLFRETAAEFGYSEIVTPIFENADLFERSVGDTSDIVEKEMYKFHDKKDRVFALRPEGTAPVVRSYVENSMHTLGGIQRLYYMGPMFRYDRPQKGRYRQFYQYGVEAIGSNHPYIDAEVIALQYTFLKKLGLKNIQLEINSLGNKASTDSYNKALAEYYAPHADKLCYDCSIRLEKNPRRLLDCKVPTCKELVAEAPVMLDYLDEECRTHFESVQTYLKGMGVEYTINPRIVRGLDYYTHTAFEFLNNYLGSQNAVGGGGRYNSLVEQIGGKDAPGIGFAGGFERLLLSLEEENLFMGNSFHPDVYVAVLGEESLLKAVHLMQQLRLKGIKVEYDPDKNSMKAQMKAADKAHATYALIVGENEINSGLYVLKTLTEGKQESLSLEDIITRLGR
ncbi:MAG: histidine--tRNA ligase [Candidatus Cloacimonetes bacterium]|nr:histidine--tRNA ligase [Candidatus Cloacimonadota bacterium]